MQPGQMVGPFKLISPLGQGAMGVVHLAEYTKNGAKVALKLIAPHLAVANPQGLARFEREAQILRQLNHPNIVRLYGYGRTGQTPYYAMEFLQGEPMDKLLARRERLTWEEVLDYGTQLALALHHAHERGIIHRDLKPSNLIVANGNLLKLTDFGIAKDLDSTQLTSAHCAVGTAAYMSPEQCRALKDIDNRSDLYSLGIVLYEWLTGQKPFRADNAVEMFRHHLDSKAPRASRVVPEIPIQLDSLIVQLMEKKRELRPRDGAAVAEALGRIREKVTAMHSAGLDAAKSPQKLKKASAEDREAAKLIRNKGRSSKSKSPPFYEQGWFVIVAAALLLGGLSTLVYVLMFMPPSAQALVDKTKALVEKGTADSIEEAVDGPIAIWEKNYGNRTDELATAMSRWKSRALRNQAEDQFYRFLKAHTKGRPFKAQNEDEEIAFQAIKEENDGKIEKAQKTWKDIGDKSPLGLREAAKAHLAAIALVLKSGEGYRNSFNLPIENGQVAELKGNWKTAFDAYRLKSNFFDLNGALFKYNELKEKIGLYPYVDSEGKARFPDPDKATDELPLWLLANWELANIPPPPAGETAEEQVRKRNETLKGILETMKNTNQVVARHNCFHLLDVYGDFPEAKVDIALMNQFKIFVGRKSGND